MFWMMVIGRGVAGVGAGMSLGALYGIKHVMSC